MRFGIQIGTYLPGDWTPAETFNHVERLAEAAHRYNLDGLFAGHRYLSGKETSLLHPFVLLGHFSGLAKGMYLGTSIFLLPLHNPVEAAEQAAALDVLCEGKFLFGVGLGYRDDEFKAFGVDKRLRRQMGEEAVQIIRRLWDEDDVTHHGRFWELEHARINPKPRQRPGPPILVGADTLRGVERALDLGDHWVPSRRHSKTFLREALPIYKAALAQRGREFVGIPMYRDLCVAESATEAEQRVRAAYEAIYQTFSRLGHPGERYDLDFEELKRERLLIGSPDEVYRQVLEYHREFGVEFMWFAVQWPGMDTQWAVETIRLLGEEVAPRVRAQTGASRFP